LPDAPTRRCSRSRYESGYRAIAAIVGAEGTPERHEPGAEDRGPDDRLEGIGNRRCGGEANMLRAVTDPRALGKLGLFVLVLGVALATGPSTRAADTSPSRTVAACTPTLWSSGCTTPVSLRGLVELLDSQAATLVPLRYLTNHFVVWADDCQTNLGSWAKAEGLLDGGQLVELTRAAGADSELVLEWLTDLKFEFRPSNVTVTLVDGLGVPLASWQLSHVLPLHWSIASFDAGANSLALETLDLTHEGLTPVDSC
jgi:hypothetical protein